MRALLVILSALGAAVLVMGLVRSWQSRKALKTGQPPEAVHNNYLMWPYDKDKIMTGITLQDS